jgi:8-oxo-dGTP diphosphatase
MVRTFAKALLVNNRGEILFLRRSDTDKDRPGGWDFPGGNVEAGEDPHDGVVREVQEESGVTVTPDSVQLAYANLRHGGYGIGCWLLYLAYVPDDTSIALSHEHSHYEWMTAEAMLAQTGYPNHRDLLEYIIANKLLDKSTVKKVTCRALIVNEAGELLLLKRSGTDPRFPGTWDLPGGGAEPNERLTQTVQRETLEECGLDINAPQLVYATANPRPEGSGTWLFYQAHVPANAVITLSDEHDAYQWIPAADLPKYTDYDVLLRMHQNAMTYRLYNAS